jgi:hypothetical protein
MPQAVFGQHLLQLLFEAVARKLFVSVAIIPPT